MLFDLISNIKKTVFFALFWKSRLNDEKSYALDEKSEKVNEKQSEKEGDKARQINRDMEKTQEVFNGIRAIE